MLDKLSKAFGFLKKDMSALADRVSTLETLRPIVKNGEDGKDGENGKDGVSPDVNEVVEKVLAKIPEPEKVDTRVIVDQVLAQIPKPRDGRDAPVVNASDVAAIVMAKIPKPKDGRAGRDGPTLRQVVDSMKAQVEPGPRGQIGPRGPAGPKGKDGVSVTDVKLTNNELFVFLDGKRKKAGSLEVPAPSTFVPGAAGGGGAAKTVSGEVLFTEELRASSSVDQNPAGLDIPLTVTFGAAQGGPEDAIQVDANGIISVNQTGLYQVRFSAQYGRSGSSGTSWIYFRTLIAFDGVNFVQVGRTVLVKLNNPNEDLATQNLATVALQQGWKTKLEIMRGSEGNDSGGLLATVPAEGSWATSYSAEAVIQRITWQQT